jgi:uncharacterized protein (DUF58 family)
MFLPNRRRWLDQSKETQFSDAWVLLAVLLTLAALALNSIFLTTAAVLLLSVAGLSWFWATFSLHGLTYSRAFSEVRAFEGETITLTLAVRNAKPLPLPWVNVRDFFPPELPVGEAHLDINPATNLAEFRTFWMLGPYQRVTRHFRVLCSIRGFHRYGPAHLTTGDAFGFFNRHRDDPDSTQFLIVYPRLYPVAELRLPTKNPFGEVRVTGSLFEDPLRPAGVREWRSADPMRRVHWKATARRQELLSRVYEPSEEQVVQLFLNVTTMERHWHGYIPELQERAISVAGSLAALASAQRLPVGIIANGALPGSDQALRLLPGRSPNQLLHILELLAAVTPFATLPIETLLLYEAPHLPWGATLVVVTAIAHDELLAALIDLAAVGRRVMLFTLAEKPPARLLHGITVYHLPHLVDDLIAPRQVHVEAAARQGLP